MKISITARHVDMSPGIRQFAEQRLGKLQRFAPDIHGVHLVLSQERSRCLAEITARLKGHELVSTEAHAEAGAAIEFAADRLEEQLRRHKEKRLTLKQRGGKPLNGEASQAEEPGADGEE